MLAFQQGVKGMKEFLLRAFLAGKELNVVYEQGVKGSIIAFELINGIVLQGTHHVCDKSFGVQIGNIGAGFLALNGMAYGMHEVGLA